jgi:hypothetical protein
VDLEAQSINFLEWHIEGGFSDLMERYIIVDMEWDEGYSKGEKWIRPVVRIGEPIEGEEVCSPTNIICLFPPFFIHRPNNYYKREK